MPSEVTDAVSGKYVLEGRVVTMEPQGVPPHGAIYIDAGEIKAVRAVAEAPPAGFEDAPRVRTGDSIYPGLTLAFGGHDSTSRRGSWTE